MEDAEHFDFASSGLVKVDEVLLYLGAAAARKEIIPWPARLRLQGEPLQCAEDCSPVRHSLLLAPSAACVQQDAFNVPLGCAR
jgi:hypothetical protein